MHVTRLRPAARLRQLGLMLALVLAFGLTQPAHATGTTWRVTTATDLADDGNLATHSGSLRFALTHAISGDLVQFHIAGVDTIFVSSTLVVPAGVAVGASRDQACPSYTAPFINIEDYPLNTLSPIISLGANASLHGVAVGGGRISVKITGANADICGSALGVTYDGDGNAVPLPPGALALSVDGPSATARQNYLNSAIAISRNGSDTRIGDTLDGNGDGNDGVRDASVTVLADTSGAAQRVTIRDPFPRALYGLSGQGVAGGDDNPTHANNWALTPTIISAITSDNYATVQVHGIASPYSLVDIFFDTQVDVVRQTPVMAGADGSFSFSGPLPGPTTQIIAASTLDDPAHPGRVGSSSQWSAPLTAHSASGEPLLAATAALTDLDRSAGPALPGDHLRFTVVMTNEGAIDVTNIRTVMLNIPPALEVTAGSGVVSGGSGFSATDGSFSGGTLTSGTQATYTLEAVLAANVGPGSLVVSGEVAADGIVTIPIVARLRTGAEPQPRVWLPLVVGDGRARGA